MRLQSEILLATVAIAALLQAAPVRATPVTDPGLIPTGATTIDFSEVVLPFGTIVTDQYSAYGSTFDSPPSFRYSNHVYPGIDGFGLDNFSGGESCPGVRTIIFSQAVDFAGFYIVTNGGDNSRLTAYLGGTLVETYDFATDYDQEYYIGFDNPATFDTLTLEIVGADNSCMVMDNLSHRPVDTDGDGMPNSADPDDDNDGVLDISDNDPLNPDICEDADGDGCDDCAVGTDDFGPLADNLPA
ncbi:MAG: thrombospondin type 3 repeat-containing protein, partial [Deltaproteobacteria bacterium]|nr:thrombospondin type 3 repeat-containing protein [Deltaproteobacteria bacterium]